ncbi:caspase family protein [Larkinella punicea]|uniref:Caspase family protein n=1 Tax=Larkinella punicea TaxID=2315727 RepID=A0A368JV01_9BACT|nr:caspase family protein [Larkinella punicea]RCR71478.1 caspase family protein [Larkinella punicea]
MKGFLISALMLATITSGFARQTYAVVVGVADYVGTVNDLKYADADARLITRFLQSPRGGSVPPNHIITLVNGQATHANSLRALRLFQSAQRDDRIIFFFSGHGFEGTFFTADGMELRHEELKAAFRKSAATTKMVWADACHSGSLRQSAHVRPVSRKTYRPLREPSLNIMVMASSRSSQKSGEYGYLKHGAFTYYLVKGAQGEADQNRDKIVTIDEHFQYVYNRVRAFTHNRQIPIIYGKFSNATPVTSLLTS